jgi:hypothetical protein
MHVSSKKTLTTAVLANMLWGEEDFTVIEIS